MYLDCETTGLNPRRDELRVVAIDGKAYDWWGDVDPNHPTIIKETLHRRRGELIVIHNAQFDLDFLAEHVGFWPEGGVFDTMIAFQLISCGRRNETTGRPISASLENVVRLTLGESLDKTWQKGPWDAFLFQDQLDYAAKDTEVLMRLHSKLEAALRKARLVKHMQLEMLLLPILLEATRKGVTLDLEAATQLLVNNRREVDRLSKKLPRNLNPRSSEQVAKFFGLPDSTEDTLREHKWKLEAQGNTQLRHLETVMKARKTLKQSSGVQKQLIARVQKDGKIHTRFKQTGTETGRLSSSEPNLQNQDHRKEVRSLFIPSAGCRFVIADYAQLEVRIAALISGDENLRAVFQDPKGDIHAETCRGIFGEPSDMDPETRKRTRTLSKNILFGSLFGGGHKTVIRFAAKSDVRIEPDEARNYQQAFFEKYPTLKRWHEKAGDTRPEFVYNLLGRRRYIQPGTAYCTRINHPVQSTAAEGMKIALVRLYHDHGILALLNVHDEIIVEVPAGEASRVKDVVEREMISSMYRASKQDPENPIVPIAVDAGVADSWAEK